MDHSTWAGAITAAAVTIGLIAQIILQIMARSAAARAATAAQTAAVSAQAANAAVIVKTNEVKAQTNAQTAKLQQIVDASEHRTSDKLSELASVASATHALTNSNMSAQLRIAALALRRVADLTSDPADVQAAEAAERMWREHEGRQAAADQTGDAKPPPL